MSIDGGGIRGLIPALILEELERRLRAAGKNRPLHTYFDLIAGTSTGGIIAAGLTCPHPDDAEKPAMTPQELVKLYKAQGASIFSRDTFRRIREALLDPHSIFEERYDAVHLEALLQRHLGLRRISEALTRILITAYDIEDRHTVVFENREEDRASEDYYFWQAARATSAAPTYFEPARVQNLINGEFHTLVDGGVFANDPGLCAYVEGIKACLGKRPILMVSLGTGYQNRPFYYRDVRNWGPLAWINPRNGAPIISVFMQSQACSTSYHLKRVLNRQGEMNYFRFDAELHIGNDDMDDASDTNLLALEVLAKEILATKQDLMGEIIKRL